MDIVKTSWGYVVYIFYLGRKTTFLRCYSDITWTYKILYIAVNTGRFEDVFLTFRICTLRQFKDVSCIITGYKINHLRMYKPDKPEKVSKAGKLLPLQFGCNIRFIIFAPFSNLRKYRYSKKFPYGLTLNTSS